MTFAVTAASGQLGAAVVRALLALGLDVIGLARTPANATDLGIEVRRGDYADVAQLTSSLRGVSALLLVSANGAPGARIQQHRNVLGAARDAGVGKVVYTSIQGADDGTAFSPVVASNRQTEVEVRNSGMQWAIGRNGIYIEPDIEAMVDYVAAGEVANSAGTGRVGYTTREELGHAYASLLADNRHDGQTYRLHGDLMTQADLTAHLNRAFGTDLTYRSLTVEEYRQDRIVELGEFMGTIIAGIYEGIRNGAHDRPSDYQAATGRPHQPWDEWFAHVGAAPSTGGPT